MLWLTRWNKLRIRSAHARHAKAGGGRRGDFYRSVWKQEAAAVGAAITFLDRSTAEISRGGRTLRVEANVTSIDDPVTRSIAGDKAMVLKLLGDHGIPTPHWHTCGPDDVFAARRFLRGLPGPCVVKPASSTGAGRGITTGVDDTTHLILAMARAAAYCDEIVLEEQVAGGVYRLLYLDGELLDAVERRPPWVRGDGVSSVRQLVEAENQARADGGLEVSQTMIGVDRELVQTLRGAGLRLSSVPPRGSVVRLKQVVNDNRSDDNVAAAGRVCDELRSVGAKAAAVVGVRLAGVDVMTTDPSLPLEQSGGVVIEVNTSPGFYYHYIRSGGSCPVARLILERWLDGR